MIQTLLTLQDDSGQRSQEREDLDNIHTSIDISRPWSIQLFVSLMSFHWKANIGATMTRRTFSKTIVLPWTSRLGTSREDLSRNVALMMKHRGQKKARQRQGKRESGKVVRRASCNDEGDCIAVLKGFVQAAGVTNGSRG